MKKLFFVLSMLLVLGSTAQGRVKYQTFEDSATNDNSTVYVGGADMGDFSKFYLWFHCNQADTSKTDSITITLQTYLDASDLWTDVLAFAEIVENDTFTYFKYFFFDSLGEIDVGEIDNAIRLEIAWTDTNTDEDADSQVLYPNKDTIVTDQWNDIDDSASTFMAVNEATLDTTEYVYITGIHADSSSVWGYDDRADVTGSGACGEAIIDSVNWYFASEWAEDTAVVAYAICIGDTANCTWGADRGTGQLLTDSAATYYRLATTTMPGYGTAWTQIYVDSIITFLWPERVVSGGQVNVSHSKVVVYYDEGRLFPTLIYKARFKFVE